MTGPGKLSYLHKNRNPFYWCTVHVYYSYAHELPFHTGKTAIDDQVHFSRWQIPGPINAY